MASLEAVICLGVTVPVAVALYLVAVGAPWL
jgi:hypothetical protein